MCCTWVIIAFRAICCVVYEAHILFDVIYCVVHGLSYRFMLFFVLYLGYHCSCHFLCCTCVIISFHVISCVVHGISYRFMPFIMLYMGYHIVSCYLLWCTWSINLLYCHGWPSHMFWMITSVHFLTSATCSLHIFLRCS